MAPSSAVRIEKSRNEQRDTMRMLANSERRAAQFAGAALRHLTGDLPHACKAGLHLAYKGS